LGDFEEAAYVDCEDKSSVNERPAIFGLESVPNASIDIRMKRPPLVLRSDRKLFADAEI